MAELADAPDLGSGVFDVQVQVLLPAPELMQAGAPSFEGASSLVKACTAANGYICTRGDSDGRIF